MNKKFGVYPMVEKDIPKVSELWNKLAYNQLSRDEYYDSAVNILTVDNTDYFKDCFKNPDRSIFVAKYNSEIIGFSEMWFYNKDFYFNVEDYAYGLHIFVDKDIETDINPLLIPYELLSACEKKAIQSGYRYIGCDVFEYNSQMQALLKFLKYKPYRTRYMKRLDEN